LAWELFNLAGWYSSMFLGTLEYFLRDASTDIPIDAICASPRRNENTIFNRRLPGES